jgi:anti-sigma B factor antagonist
MISYRIEEDSGLTIVRLEGPLDVAGAHELRDVLGERITGAGARVLLDLRDVTLIDSSGVGVLVGAHRRADAAGAGFALAGARATVGRVFALTRTDRLLRIYATVDEGVQALAGR